MVSVNWVVKLKQLVCIALAGLTILSGHTIAGDTVTLLGAEVIKRDEIYIAQSSVNVRKSTSVKSRKVGHFKKGEKIHSAGVTKDGFWIVAVEAGKPIGFVYAKVLLAVLNGALDRDIVGQVDLFGNRRCNYKIHFSGKSAVEGQIFFMADYDVIVSCVKNKTKIVFPAQMFMAEAPNYTQNSNPVFQINLDVLDEFHAADDVFSTIMFFHPREREVRLGGVSYLNYGSSGKGKKKQGATTLIDALRESLILAINTWSERAWSDIYKNVQK